MFAEIYPVFKQKYPNYLVNLSGNTTRPPLEQIVKGILGIAIPTVADDAPISPPSVSMPREGLVLAVSVSLGGTSDCQRQPGTVLRALDISKVRNENSIISCSGIIVRDITNSVSEQYRISSRIICEINNHSSSLKIVANGLGITAIPLSYVDSNPHVGYFSTEDGISWNICTITRRNFKSYESDHYLVDLVGECFVKEQMGN